MRLRCSRRLLLFVSSATEGVLEEVVGVTRNAIDLRQDASQSLTREMRHTQVPHIMFNKHKQVSTHMQKGK